LETPRGISGDARIPGLRRIFQGFASHPGGRLPAMRNNIYRAASVGDVVARNLDAQHSYKTPTPFEFAQPSID